MAILVSKKKYAYGFATQIVNVNLLVFHDGEANGISTVLDIYPNLGADDIIVSREKSGRFKEWMGK